MDHRRQLRAGEDSAREQQRLVRHQQPAGARLRLVDRGREVRVDALPVAGERGELLLHRLASLQPGLAHVERGNADQEVGEAQDALDEREHAVAVEGRADEARRPRVPVEEDVLPGDLDVVEDDQRVDLVEAVGERVVSRRARGRRNRTGRCA